MAATDSGGKDDALSDSAREVADKEKERDRPAKSKNAAAKSALLLLRETFEF